MGEESIFLTIKKLLGVSREDDSFDEDILIAINMALEDLTQIGVGDPEGFGISGAEETWLDFIGNGKKLQSVKNYVYLKSRLIFDPPTSSVLLGSIEKLMGELIFRLNVTADRG